MANGNSLEQLALGLAQEQEGQPQSKDLESLATQVAQEQGLIPKAAPDIVPAGLIPEIRQLGIAGTGREVAREAPQAVESLRQLGGGIPRGAAKLLLNIPGLRQTPGGKILAQQLADEPESRLRRLGEAVGAGATIAAPIGAAGEIVAGALGAGAEAAPTLATRILSPAARLTAAGTTGTLTAPPGQRTTGGILTTLGQGAAEALPAAIQAGRAALPALQRSAAGQLFGRMKDFVGDIVDKLRGGETAENLNPEVFNRTAQNYEETRGIGKNNQPLDEDQYRFRVPEASNKAAFDAVINHPEAQKLGFNKNSWADSISNAQNEIKDKLNQFPDNPQALEAQKFLDRAKKYKINSIKDATNVPQELNNEWRIADTKDNPLIKRLTGGLKEGVRQGMQDTAAGNPEVRQLFETANNQFKNEVIPHQQFGGKPTDFIKRYRTQTPVTDKFIENNVKFNQPERTQHFLERLPDQESRSLVASHLFNKEAENPDAFLRKYAKFDQRSRELLFPEDHQQLNQLVDMRQRVPQAFRPTAPTGTLGGLARRGLGLLGAGDIATGRFAPGAILTSPILAREGAKAVASLPGMQERLLANLLRGERPTVPLSRPGILSLLAATQANRLTQAGAR
jgi:hypothetical protein